MTGHACASVSTHPWQPTDWYPSKSRMIHGCYRLAQRKPGIRSALNGTNTHGTYSHTTPHPPTNTHPHTHTINTKAHTEHPRLGGCRHCAFHILSDPAKCHFQVPECSCEHMETKLESKYFTCVHSVAQSLASFQSVFWISAHNPLDMDHVHQVTKQPCLV